MTFIIAEIAQAHDGSLGILRSYIDAIAATGVDAIKFQTHIAHAESSEHEPFRVNFSYEDNTRYDYWQRLEFTQEQWIEIGKHCKSVGLQFWSSPFSNAAVDLLEKARVDGYKVGSGEVNNFLLLEKICQTCKPIIISSGMSSFEELDKTVAFLESKNADFKILQCYTAYPTTPEQYGLHVIAQLRQRYKQPIGFSDHSATIAANVAAVALGAKVLEFHAVWDKRMFGPDAMASLNIDEISQLVTDVRNIDKAISSPINKDDTTAFAKVKQIFEKSLAINKDLKKNHILTFDDLESKKPKGFGILASEFQSVIGLKLNKDLKAYEFLNQKDIS
ncbi:N-acetylneuraminate synthase family protein [Nonlabens sp.]|jgi:N-acetylneuraminate synthase|uniref:N-acetylneuraminate synthase family protein n=1 Tax=Nonlabens sp. TaxID=1888209 RepID=UPI003F699DB0